MSDFTTELLKTIQSIEPLVAPFLKSMDGIELPEKAISYLNAYEENLEGVKKLVKENADEERIISHIKNVAVYCNAFRSFLPNLQQISSEIKEKLNTATEMAAELQIKIEGRPKIFKSLSLPDNFQEFVDKTKIDYVNELNELNEYENRIKSIVMGIEANQKKTYEYELKLNELDHRATSELKKIEELYSSTLKLVEEKQKQIDSLLGFASSGVVVGNYDSNARSEKSMADWLRYASIFCMALVVVVIGYSFWETTQEVFKWQNSIFRISLAFLLSIPSAYLAKESAKHREQYYNHLQTSLDLKTIDPYIASLPISEQHKIKYETANRIFVTRDYSKVGDSSYPINAQEVIMKLIDKFDFKAKDK